MPTFTTTLIQQGNNVGIEVPEDVVTSLGAGKRVPVVVTLNGHVYPSTIAVMGGRFLIPVSAQIRADAGVAGGETHDVTIEHDASSRDTPVPDDLAAALDAAGVRAGFYALSPSRRKEHVRQVTSAKAEETRARRIATIVGGLA